MDRHQTDAAEQAAWHSACKWEDGKKQRAEEADIVVMRLIP
jgi:hypothetical protein